MKNSGLIIHTLGEFSITDISGQHGWKQNRSNKVATLLQYLIQNRKQGATRSELLFALFGSSDLADPGNSLKSLIHRARILLIDAGLPDFEYILFTQGKYFWNNEIPCEIDSEIFEDVISKIENPDLNSEEKSFLARQALRMYKGDYLPYTSTESWVSPLLVSYQGMYHKALRVYNKLMAEKGEYKTLLPYLEYALKIFPYDEEIHLLRISCLYELKQYKEALTAYEKTTSMLLEELNINPSKEMIALYHKMLNGISFQTETLPEIKEKIQEESNLNGAYYSSYLGFVDSYRFLVRMIERNGSSVFLLLGSLVNSKNLPFDAEDKIEKAAEDFFHAIKHALRRGDLFTRYSKTQFLMLLSGINQENCSIVENRIRESFNASKSIRGVYLQFKEISAVPEQDLIESESKSVW